MSPETEAAVIEFNSTAEGWTTKERALEFAQLVIDEKPMLIVEGGVFAGGSMIPMALALKELGRGKIYGIDPWRVEAAIEAENQANQEWWTKNVDLEKMQQLSVQAIWRYDLEAHAMLLRARAENCCDLFREIDIWNCDGNHSEEASCRDVDLYLPRVKHGGLILFDDSGWQSTQKAVRMLDQACEIVKDAGTYRWYRKP